MPDPVHVPGIPGPYRQLCWQQDPVRLLRCDRARNHNGLHSWEWAAITTALAEAEAELAAARADIANWPVCEQHKPGMWDGDPPCVICEAHTAIADLAALKGRACDCCTFRWPGNTRDRDVCGKVSIPGHSVAVVLCDQLHRTCGAWAAKETP